MECSGLIPPWDSRLHYVIAGVLCTKYIIQGVYHLDIVQEQYCLLHGAFTSADYITKTIGNFVSRRAYCSCGC